MDHAPYCVNNAAARGEAAATSQKRVHELSSTSVLAQKQPDRPRTDHGRTVNGGGPGLGGFHE